MSFSQKFVLYMIVYSDCENLTQFYTVCNHKQVDLKVACEISKFFNLTKYDR